MRSGKKERERREEKSERGRELEIAIEGTRRGRCQRGDDQKIKEKETDKREEREKKRTRSDIT